MSPIIFSIGNFEIRWYSFLILIAIIVGIFLAEKEGIKHNIPKDFIFNLAFWVIIFSLIGARIFYVIFNFSIYENDLISIFKVWNGGLAIYGGIIFGFITAIIYCKKYNVQFLKIADISVASLIIGQAIGRWGNFFNCEAHGPATNLANLQSTNIIPQFVIDGMKIDGIYYMPTFYYESLWCLLGFIVLIILRRIKYIKNGQLTAIYLMWYGVGRFFIERYRTDSLMLGGFKIAQIISVILFLIGMVIFMIQSRKGHFEDLYSESLPEIRW